MKFDYWCAAWLIECGKITAVFWCDWVEKKTNKQKKTIKSHHVCFPIFFLVWPLSCVCRGPLPCSSAPSPRYTAPPQTLINHCTHWVTFALFKEILQTLAFRGYDYLPCCIRAANPPALWAVYLMVFVYRLTFSLHPHLPLNTDTQFVLLWVEQSVERETSDVLSMILILKSWPQ